MNHRGIWTVLWAVCAVLALCASALAQVVEPMGTFVPPRNHRMQGAEAQAPQQPAPASTPANVLTATPTAMTPPSLLDKPAEPAKIDLASGRLTIHADNSSLEDILHQLTAGSGMTVDGLGTDQRIFGNYGPGDPQEVLSALLDGSGYNVVMLGRTETGTPKQISLTPRGAGVPKGSGSSRPQQMAQDEDTDDEVQQPQPVTETPVPPPPQAPGGNPQQNNGVRTPQQMLQELQQMRQQQMQQQSSPQQ